MSKVKKTCYKKPTAFRRQLGHHWDRIFKIRKSTKIQVTWSYIKCPTGLDANSIALKVPKDVPTGNTK